jgi:hypothetical protein
MSSRLMLAQDDFHSLALDAGQNTDDRPLDDYHEFSVVGCGGSGDLIKACEQDEIYHPVHFIPDEVIELIRNWEETYRKKQALENAVHSMGTVPFTDFPSTESVLDPIRCVSVPQPPPKRFYRTFWRSVSQRILRFEKANAFNRATVSSRDAGPSAPGGPP